MAMLRQSPRGDISPVTLSPAYFRTERSRRTLLATSSSFPRKSNVFSSTRRCCGAEERSPGWQNEALLVVDVGSFESDVVEKAGTTGFLAGIGASQCHWSISRPKLILGGVQVYNKPLERA